jgi:S1-C subfamily serine protease
MRFDYRLPGIIGQATIISALVVMQPLGVMALTGEEVNNIAREVTVLIRGDKGHGSGVIISQKDETYYVLTAKHVIVREDNYKIVTADKTAHAVDYKKIKQLPDADLAVVEFTSKDSYKTAKIATSDTISEGKSVFVSGWPQPGGTGQLVRQFTDGRVSGFLDKPVMGYQMSYTNVTRRGMSGGPVVDAGGRVVAIHGMADSEEAQSLEAAGVTPEAAAKIAALIKPGFNYGIPIKTFLTQAPQQGIYLSLQVEDTPATELGAPYVASTQTDERDKIENINQVLDTVDRTVNTIDRGVDTIRGIFRF